MSRFLFNSFVILILILLFFNNITWRNPFLGVLLTIVYLSILGKLLGYYLPKRILGPFLLIYFISLSLALPIFFYKINFYYFYFFLFIITLLILYFTRHLSLTDIIKIENENRFPLNWLLKFVYLLILFSLLSGFILLFLARSGEYIVSPWQTINRTFLYFCFIAALFLFVLIFYEQSWQRILLVLILFSLLIHAYIPIVYQIGAGVDTWIHLGTERRLLSGQAEPPTIFDKGLKFGPLSIPKLFIPNSKNAYAATWGLTIAFSWLTSLDIFLVDKYLLFFLWSIFFPLLVFEISRVFFGDIKLSLITVFFSLIPYLFQVDGAITLPKNFSFLCFIFFLYLLTHFLLSRQKLFLPLLFFTFSFYFNYQLYFILAIEFFILALIWKDFPFEDYRKKIILLICFLLFIISLPLADYLTKFSYFPYRLPEAIEIYLPKFKRFIIFLFTGGLTHFENEKIFTDFLPLQFNWSLFLVPFVLILSILGVVEIIKGAPFKLKFLFLNFFIIIFFNLFLEFWLMWGLKIFGRRLLSTFIFLDLFFLATGFWYIYNKVKLSQVLKLAIFSGLFSFFLIVTYTSGPFLEAITINEYQVAKFIQNDIKNFKDKKVCLLAHGKQNLVIQSLTGNIIAGGFSCPPPQCDQPQRIKLLGAMISNPRPWHFEVAMDITKSNLCYFIIPKDELGEKAFNQAKNFFGQPEIVGNIYIWRYSK